MKMITYRVYRYIKVILLILCFLTIFKTSEASFAWVDIGVNGLTCSMCTRSVEKRILRLDFVSKVEMNLETTNGRIFFKDNVPVSLDQIAQSVREAGFSVQYFKVTFDLDDVFIASTGEFRDQQYSFHWIDYTRITDKKTLTLQVINEGFLPKGESRKLFQKAPALKMRNQKGLYYVVEEK